MKTGKLLLSVLLFSFPFVIQAEPFWGAKASSPAGTPPEVLQDGEFVWESQAQTKGPIAIVVSLSEQRAYVFRNGIEIGLARLSVKNPEQMLGTHAYMAIAGKSASSIKWKAVGLPRHATDIPVEPDSQAIDHVKLPSRFVAALKPLLQPGVTMMITDAPIHQHTTGAQLDVIIANHGEES